MAESTSGSEQSFRTWPVPELESLSLRATMVGLQADEVDALQFRSWLGRHNLDIVAACAALLLTLIVRRFFRSERLRLAPGPRKWPVIGNLPSVMGTTPAHLNFLRLAAEYGPIVRLELGAVQILVISSAELAKEILETQDHIFASRPSNIKAEVAFFGRDLLFAPLGDRFRLMRKVLAVELLGPKRIQQFRVWEKRSDPHPHPNLAANMSPEDPFLLYSVQTTACMHIVIRFQLDLSFSSRSIGDFKSLQNLLPFLLYSVQSTACTSLSGFNSTSPSAVDRLVI